MKNPRIESTSIDLFAPVKSAPAAFAGGTTDARGDENGATSGITTLYNVTGDVLVRIFGICTVDLTGSGTLEVGITGNTALLIAQSTGSDIIESELWVDATPTTIGGTLASVTGPFIVPNGLDIIETTAGASITAGNIHYIALWKPLSPDGNLVKVEAT